MAGTVYAAILALLLVMFLLRAGLELSWLWTWVWTGVGAVLLTIILKWFFWTMAGVNA